MTCLSNSGASNWDSESVDVYLKEKQIKGILNGNYKLLYMTLSDTHDSNIQTLIFAIALKNEEMM